MAGFNFERNLEHQVEAVNSVLRTFHGTISREDKNKTVSNYTNPTVTLGGALLSTNLNQVQTQNNIDTKFRNKKNSIFDISMETGTGKTYTYTKMMFELHKNISFGKFIIIVPTLSIKAGTLSFLRSKATKEHFRTEYDTEIKTYLVESKKSNKNKKESIPQPIKDFVNAQRNSKTIHVLVINGGMINSDTMNKSFDTNLLDKYKVPFEALASTNPITIIDEPHRFSTANKTWKNIEKLNSQFIFRYGATFDNKYENLLYNLSSVDAFNNDLVKGVMTYVEEFNNSENSIVTLISTDGKEAKFELNTNNKKSTFLLSKNESLSKIHDQMSELKIENLNKTVVLLSNGLELKKGSKINPYSYSQSIQSKMMENTIKKHFELEKKLLLREAKIKPLTLFFIDDIDGYRNKDGNLKKEFETVTKNYIQKALQDETNEFYRKYLQDSLKDISSIHGGYFSKDNSDKDEKIEKEINEILHDKESLLSLDNTRRFIFSKWTLREGWDNPNVFQICKLRSSGSVTSKLQEVGRGLRLPVNEHMARVQENGFYLNYFVDFTEKDFADSLINEINSKSQTVWIQTPTKLTDEMIKDICDFYKIEEEFLLETLDNENIIKRNNDFKEDGYDKLKELYPIITDGVKNDKIKSGNKEKKKATIRSGKYDELKHLWEAINQKVILEYKINSEQEFELLLKNYILENIEKFKPQGVNTHIKVLEFKDSIAYYNDVESINDELLPVNTISYKEFLTTTAIQTNININTLHKVFFEIKDKFDINQYRNMQTIRTIKSGFNKFLLDNAIDKFSIGYDKITNALHPTKFTNQKGELLTKINASDLGVLSSSEPTPKNYLFEEIYYDSNLEKENIKKDIKEVIVFTKIPKNSIKIPVAGGNTYSPDFAYIIKDTNNNKTLNLIVEIKDKEKRDLYKDEEQKIKHAQELFNSTCKDVLIEFKTQFKDIEIKDILKKYINKT
jgi:type III restriction enzyme